MAHTHVLTHILAEINARITWDVDNPESLVTSLTNRLDTVLGKSFEAVVTYHTALREIVLDWLQQEDCPAPIPNILTPAPILMSTAQLVPIGAARFLSLRVIVDIINNSYLECGVMTGVRYSRLILSYLNVCTN